MRLILSLLLVFAFASSSFAERAPSSVIAGVDAQEAALESEIDRQADVVFKDFIASTGSRVPLSALQKAKRAAVFKLKQLHVLTDILKAAGPAPATTIVATELLTNFVLAPIAGAFGRPAIAGVMITIPWGLVTGFGVFSFQVMKERFKLSRALGVSSLRSLDTLRSLVIGYDLKYRVSSVIYQSLIADQAEFEVLRSSWSFEEAKVPTLKITELEAIVRAAPEGPAYLEKIYVEKLDPAFYSALLLRFTNESDVLTSQLIQIVRARMPELKSETDPLGLRRHLIGVDDVSKQLDREIRNYQTTKAGLKKRVKAGTLSAEEAGSLKQHALDEIVRLRGVRAKVMRHEYSVLLEARATMASGQGDIRSSRVAAARASDLVSLALEARVQPPKAAVVGAAIAKRASTLEKVRAVIQAVQARSLVCQDLFY